MKLINICLILSVLTMMMCGCDDEKDPIASEDLGFTTLFGPGEDADPMVKELYDKYGVWVRFDFEDQLEVTNGILGSEGNKCTVVKIEDKDRESALLFMKNLLSNVNPEFTKKFFPLEFFFVKSFVAGWPKDKVQIGRSRLLITWPILDGNPIEHPENHYYEDYRLTYGIWNELATMITSRMPEPIADFANAGKAYDGGAARDQMWAEYEKDGDWDKVVVTRQAICDAGGHVSFSGSVSFETDFGQWMAEVVTSSYSTIKDWYLDGGKTYQDKYTALIKYLKEQGWDIQAAGNLFSEKYNAYLDTLPDDDEE